MSAAPDKIKRRAAPRYGESGYKRRAFDFYATPDWVTDILLEQVPFRGAIWEPAAGDGRMVRRIIQHREGYAVVGSDIRKGPHTSIVGNFFQLEMPEEVHRGDDVSTVRSIVTNPPYDQATDFVRRALHLAKARGGMVAMLLNHCWDTAATRRELYAKLTRKIVITQRIRWIEDTTGSPRENHAWYVWDLGNQGPCWQGWAP